jgi:hypothetical protein
VPEPGGVEIELHTQAAMTENPSVEMRKQAPASPPSSAASYGRSPGDLSAHELMMIERTEEAIREGLQLEQWCREQLPRVPQFPLNLKKVFRVPNSAKGFFGALDLSGSRTSVMGCVQEVDFGPLTAENPSALLQEFVMGDFLKLAHWSYADGHPGGFTLEQSVYKTVEGEYGRTPAETCAGCPDWRDLGKRFEWVLLTVQIHDFVMDFGPFRKRLREAACVAANSGFVHVLENPSDEYALEVSVGYPFVRFAPIPNFFGFGPGKFGTAVKLFSFFLTRSGRLKVRMIFAAAPRCQKVFDFGTRWPDPIYGGASLLRGLTLGQWNPERFHDRLDSQMLAQHCRVHQALMDGVEKVWAEWLSTRVSVGVQSGHA